MSIEPHDAADRQRLEELVRSEADAKQRDRYRAVLLLMGDVEPEGDEVAEALGRSPRFVDQWAARYRRGGLEALRPRRRPGRRPRLTAEQEAALKARVEAGPLPADRTCALRGRHVVRILAEEFAATYTLAGAYDLLRRIGLSSLSPRPRHRKNDVAAMAAFEAGAPLLSPG